MPGTGKVTDRSTSGSRKPRSYRCRRKFDRVYQFEVALRRIEPRIWRRMQVPDRYSFWDLHCAITDCFGWLDCHLHQFTVRWPESGETDIIGIPDDEGFEDGPETLPGWRLCIAEYFSMENRSCEYEYDFGDCWRHSVVLEAILPREDGVGYPRCVGGERACPPEDVGGEGGYRQFLKAVSYHNAAGHDEMLEWCGGWFDPEWFDPGLVRFGNPDARWRVVFRDGPAPNGMRTVQYHRMRRHPETEEAG